MAGLAPHVVVRRSARRTRTVTAYREREAIVVLLPMQMSAADEKRCVAEMVAKVLAREASRAAPRSDDELMHRAQELAARYLTPVAGPVQPHGVIWVRNQRRRWGSCTPTTGAIRLSDRLRSVPDWVVDYVLLHELAHLVEPTHSARFWSLVDRYPRAERAKGFLEGYLAGAGQPGGQDEHDVD